LDVAVFISILKRITLSIGATGGQQKLTTAAAPAGTGVSLASMVDHSMVAEQIKGALRGRLFEWRAMTAAASPLDSFARVTAPFGSFFGFTDAKWTAKQYRLQPLWKLQ
jgi:hypothetical protein